MRLLRPGWTLHEMLVSLTVSGIIVALAAAGGVGQLRLYRGVGEAVAVRTQVAQAALVAGSVVRQVAGRRHVRVATDSAFEAAITIGVSFTCESDTGRIVVARAVPSGHTLAAFSDRPVAGDALEVLTMVGSPGLLDASVAADPQPASCAAFPDAEAWSMGLVEPFVIEQGMPVRFTRRVRVSHYRASDGYWYLGYREWNAALDRFNTIQPVAGPLLPRSGAPGFSLEYRDASGAPLDPPDPSRIALVTITARGDSRGPVKIDGMSSPAAPLLRDSSILSVSIR